MSNIKNNLGGKAKSLNELTALGLPVPPFVVFTESEINNLTQEMVLDKTSRLSSKYYAVRSSANLEDGRNHSFAGQFESALFISKNDLYATIVKLLDAKDTQKVKSYLANNGIDGKTLQLAIIVQEMIDADVSGVAFGKNPVKPYKNEQVVSAVFGLGEGLVSGKLDADMFTKKNSGNWVHNVVDKKEMLTYQNEKLEYKRLDPIKSNSPTMMLDQLEAVKSVLHRLEDHFGLPQDIEFCFREGKMYLLQSRPITTLDSFKEHVIWDNSNIIESYPGVTLPFTFSFILKIYESVYKNFSYMLGVSKSQIANNDEIFAEMLGHVKGRVYYHLINWYKALALLPAYQINASYMEKMMGVTEPLGTKFTLNGIPSKLVSYWNLIKTTVKLLAINKQLPSKKRAFSIKVNQVIKSYKTKDYSTKATHEIWSDYKDFKNILVHEWTPPLANDLLAMIYFGTLEKICTQWLKAPQLHTEIVVGRYPLKSVEPAKLLNLIIETAISEDYLTQIQQSEVSEVWVQIKNGKLGNTGQLILDYIAKYGDRSIGELKLENDTYTQHPEAFIKLLQSYNNTSTYIEPKGLDIDYISQSLPWYRKLIFKYIADKAAETVADRENLRFDRTLGFGTVRMFLWHIAKQWENEGILEQFRDIFYLREEEIDQYFLSPSSNLKQLITQRKSEYEAYRIMDTPPGRIHQVDGELDIEEDEPTNEEGQLHGIPCCAGQVEGKVRILDRPDEIKSLEGDILVTTSTDPGWITIFHSASAIIVERGSTLSHAAIVSRELGIPCIVGVKGITKLLKNGDTIRMNGKTGKIIQL